MCVHGLCTESSTCYIRAISLISHTHIYSYNRIVSTLAMLPTNNHIIDFVCSYAIVHFL